MIAKGYLDLEARSKIVYYLTDAIFYMPIGYVLVNCDLGSEDEVLDELRRIPEVTDASLVYGPYDIVVRVQSDSMEKLRELVTWQVRRTDRVKSTITLIKIVGQGESTTQP